MVDFFGSPGTLLLPPLLVTNFLLLLSFLDFRVSRKTEKTSSLPAPCSSFLPQNVWYYKTKGPTDIIGKKFPLFPVSRTKKRKYVFSETFCIRELLLFSVHYQLGGTGSVMTIRKNSFPCCVCNY